jgi:hypothetical protein
VADDVVRIERDDLLSLFNRCRGVVCEEKDDCEIGADDLGKRIQLLVMIASMFLVKFAALRQVLLGRTAGIIGPGCNRAFSVFCAETSHATACGRCAGIVLRPTRPPLHFPALPFGYSRFRRFLTS